MQMMVFINAVFFISLMLCVPPAMPQVSSSGQPVAVNDPWQLTFIKLAGGLDAAMPDPTLSYDAMTKTYEVTAAGHDIWDSQDGCAFAYIEATGDFSVEVRMEHDFTGPATNTWSKAGVMVRDSVTPESKFVFYNTSRNDGGDANMQWRDADNQAAGWQAPDAGHGALGYPHWLRLDRVGNDFIGYYSTNGAEWTQGANPAIHTNANFSDPVYIGFALTSHEVSNPTTTVLSEFLISGLDIGPPVLTISIVGGAVTLSWKPFGTGSYTIEWSDDLRAWTPEVGMPITETTWPVGWIETFPKWRFWRVSSPQR